jgi:hypothetical protein
MQRFIAAIALCIFAQGAIAECVATPATIKAHPAAQAQPPARAELIKTAAAGTRDEASPAIHQAARTQDDGQDHPRRGGTAMLLAALALMSGIALRRYGAPDA